MSVAKSAPSVGWTYRHGGSIDLVEVGTVIGSDVGLPAHFHDEDQLSVVQAGQRCFFVGSQAVVLQPGRCALIPAGTVHQSMAESSEVVCLNLYVPAARYALSAMIDEIDRLRCGGETIDPSFVLAIVRRHRLGFARAFQGEGLHRNIAALATSRGMSREGFSRCYTRRFGMPPHKHDLASRLNQARRQLRAGGAIAEVALEAGFADQSHLGRWFRRLFGTTPGRYRAGWPS